MSRWISAFAASREFNERRDDPDKFSRGEGKEEEEEENAGLAGAAANWQRGQLIITRGRFRDYEEIIAFNRAAHGRTYHHAPINPVSPFLLRSIAISCGTTRRHEVSPPSIQKLNWLDLIRQIGLSLPESALALFDEEREGGRAWKLFPRWSFADSRVMKCDERLVGQGGGLVLAKR